MLVEIQKIKSGGIAVYNLKPTTSVLHGCQTTELPTRDGSASFSAHLDVGTPNSATHPGTRVSHVGQLVSNCESTGQKGLIIKALNQEKAVIRSDGSAEFAGDVTAFSDITLKENIEVIPGALDKVSEIRGVTFTRKDREDNQRQAGVIAQEVEAVLPEVVSTNDNGIKSVAYGNLVGLLIEAVKELKAEVETLKAERN